MNTPFDRLVREISQRRFHSHRSPEHSDILSQGIFEDLQDRCTKIRDDLKADRIRKWINVRAPGGRGRRIDLFIGEPIESGKPDLSKIRIAIENKSVITAHRNSTNRYDDLAETLEAIHNARKEAIVAATVLIGLAPRFLNVQDGVKRLFRKDNERFEKEILPRLSSGDQALWEEFESAVSVNQPGDARKTLDKFRLLPTRKPAFTHIPGFDFALFVPIHIDNVNPPTLPRPNELGINVDESYETMLAQVCHAYSIRWP